MRNEKAQVLTILLFLVAISITVTFSAVAIVILNSQNAVKSQEGAIAYYLAENGAENAILRLIRDPANYTGETITFEDGAVTISLFGANPWTITSVGVNGNFRRTIEIRVSYNNGTYTVTSWKEIYTNDQL